jgi:hypothetical protein
MATQTPGLGTPLLKKRKGASLGGANAPEHQMTSQAVNMLDPHTGIDSSLGRTLAGLMGYPLGKLALAFGGLYGDIPKNPMAPSNIGPWGVVGPTGRLVGPAAESEKEAKEKARQENAAWRSRQRLADKAVTDARKGVHVARVTPATGFFGMSAVERAAESAAAVAAANAIAAQRDRVATRSGPGAGAGASLGGAPRGSSRKK